MFPRALQSRNPQSRKSRLLVYTLKKGGAELELLAGSELRHRHVALEAALAYGHLSLIGPKASILS